MKFTRSILLFLIICLSTASAPSYVTFEETQKKFDRVNDAYNRKEEYFYMKCRNKEIPEETFGKMFIRVFKQEEILEIWVQKANGKYILFNELKVYSMSGLPGPKRRQGDSQVPEGYYHINDFNPLSNYHLSLGINYPNQSDRRLSTASNLGGDIYIHGGKSSAGCVAMSNYYIEDIYLAAVKARTNGQMNIPVHIYPFKPTVINYEYYTRVPALAKYAKFWKNLQMGFQLFERTNKVPEVTVGADGYYIYSDAVTVLR